MGQDHVVGGRRNGHVQRDIRQVAATNPDSSRGESGVSMEQVTVHQRVAEIQQHHGQKCFCTVESSPQHCHCPRCCHSSSTSVGMSLDGPSIRVHAPEIGVSSNIPFRKPDIHGAYVVTQQTLLDPSPQQVGVQLMSLTISHIHSLHVTEPTSAPFTPADTD